MSKLLKDSGVTCDEESLKILLERLAGKSIPELIKEGRTQMATIGGGGAASAGAAAAGGAAAATRRVSRAVTHGALGASADSGAKFPASTYMWGAFGRRWNGGS